MRTPAADPRPDRAWDATLEEGATLTIDLDAVVSNFRLLARRVFPAACGAVVKADGYGLGAAQVARPLFAAGCRVFFVAHPEEGLALRLHLPQATIVVLHGVPSWQTRACAEADLVPVLNSRRQIADWAREGRSRGERMEAYVQVDTGMSRFGLSDADLDALGEDPRDLEALNVRCVMSHLACADDPDDVFNLEQLERFDRMRAKLPTAPASLSASSGCFLPACFHYNIVRPGAALYGVAPSPGRDNPMRPVVRLEAPVLQLRDVPAGTPVGYARAASTYRASRLATIGIGYADGYLRSGGGRGRVWYGDSALPVLGRVSMDSLVLDATEVDLREGAMIEVVGDHRDVDAVGVDLRSSGYEVLTGLGHRYRRRYLPARSTP